MANVTLTINGKTYRIGCADGEEAHFIALGERIEGELQGLKGAVGDVGELRLLVMVALKLADEVADLQRRHGSKTAEVEAATATLIEIFATSLEATATRMEAVAGRLERA